MGNSATLAFSYSRSTRRRANVIAFRPGVTPPTISGTPGAGNVFTLNPGTWAPATATLTEYQWFSGHNEIVGQTAVTYTQTAADASAIINCAMTVTDPSMGVLSVVVQAPIAA